MGEINFPTTSKRCLFLCYWLLWGDVFTLFSFKQQFLNTQNHCHKLHLIPWPLGATFVAHRCFCCSPCSKHLSSGTLHSISAEISIRLVAFKGYLFKVAYRLWSNQQWWHTYTFVDRKLSTVISVLFLYRRWVRHSHYIPYGECICRVVKISLQLPHNFHHLLW